MLNVPVEALLSDSAASRKTRATLSPRLERRLRQIERLGPKPKQQLLSIIDTFIAAAQSPTTQRSGPRSSAAVRSGSRPSAMRAWPSPIFCRH